MYFQSILVQKRFLYYSRNTRDSGLLPDSLFSWQYSSRDSDTFSAARVGGSQNDWSILVKRSNFGLAHRGVEEPYGCHLLIVSKCSILEIRSSNPPILNLKGRRIRLNGQFYMSTTKCMLQNTDNQ